MTEAEFWGNVRKSAEPDGCWEWTAGMISSGYGELRWNGKEILAHRVAWELATGAPPKLCILHRCDNPKCIRFDHLFEGTKKDNWHDAINKGRAKRLNGVMEENHNKTHCKHGHAFDSTNTYEYRGHRFCKVCRAEGCKRWRRNKRQ